jgi:hypothetical protein
MGNTEQAIAALDRGMEKAGHALNSRGFINLLIAALRLYEREGKLDKALELTNRAADLLGQKLPPVEALQLWTTYLRLRRLAGQEAGVDVFGARSEALDKFKSLTMSDLHSSPDVVRQAAAELGDQPSVLGRALEVVGLGPLDSRESETIASALEKWDRETPRVEIAKAARVKGRAGWKLLLKRPDPKGLGQQMWELMNRYGFNEHVVDAVVDSYRHSVSPSRKRSTRLR